MELELRGAWKERPTYSFRTLGRGRPTEIPDPHSGPGAGGLEEVPSLALSSTAQASRLKKAVLITLVF